MGDVGDVTGGQEGDLRETGAGVGELCIDDQQMSKQAPGSNFLLGSMGGIWISKLRRGEMMGKERTPVACWPDSSTHSTMRMPESVITTKIWFCHWSISQIWAFSGSLR